MRLVPHGFGQLHHIRASLAYPRTVLKGGKKTTTTVTVKVVDECPKEHCDASHIDLSPAAFGKLEDLGRGEIEVAWSLS